MGLSAESAATYRTCNKSWVIVVTSVVTTLTVLNDSECMAVSYLTFKDFKFVCSLLILAWLSRLLHAGSTCVRICVLYLRGLIHSEAHGCAGSIPAAPAHN